MAHKGLGTRKQKLLRHRVQISTTRETVQRIKISPCSVGATVYLADGSHERGCSMSPIPGKNLGAQTMGTHVIASVAKECASSPKARLVGVALAAQHHLHIPLVTCWNIRSYQSINKPIL